MRERISKLLQRVARLLAPVAPVDGYPCLKTLTRGDLRMRVFHNRKRCGQLGCIVQLSLPQDEEWQDVALLCGEDIHDAAWLLGEAATFLDSIRDCNPEP